MKKIHLLILQAFIRPFLVTFCIVMFVLLMLFLFKYIDDLIGKGLEWYTILELLGYQCIVQLTMALPLSMLLSSIMTFGNLGESYELVAIKAAGVSLRNAMTPLFILVSLFAGGSFLFSDYTLPVVNLKMGTMLLDIRNQKVDFFIKPGVFNDAIPGYAIRSKEKSKDGTILYDLLIYDHNAYSSKANNVLLAKEGYIHNSADNEYMLLQLKDGVRYEESRVKNAQKYDERQQFTRFRFKEHTQKFDMESFKSTKTDMNQFKSHHQMLNLKQLKYYTDSNRVELDSMASLASLDIKRNINYFNHYYATGSPSVGKVKGKLVIPDFTKTSTSSDRQQIRNAITSAIGQATYIKDYSTNNAETIKPYTDKDIRYRMEWHRKFTLAVSCLLLFGIGAPLGAIIRKGGLGLPVVMAIIFFLIYHVIFTISEKAARDGSLEPIWGMWMAIIVLTPLAVFLTYKSTSDSALFDIDQYKIKLQNALKWIKQKTVKNKKKSLES